MKNICILSTPPFPTMLPLKFMTSSSTHTLNLFIVAHMYTCLGLTPSDCINTYYFIIIIIVCIIIWVF